MQRSYLYLSLLFFSGAWNAPVWALEHCVIDPLLPYTHLGGQSGDTQVSISADFSTADFEQADFSGSVKLHQGDKHLFAPMLRYQNALAQVMIEEGGLFASPKLVVQGREGRYDLSKQTIDFKQADYLMRTKTHTAIGSAQNVHFDQKQQNSSFEQLTWTTCARQSPVWHLQAQQLTLDQQTQRGVARNITFNIKNIPVLYLPYFSFPITQARQSGFLTPMLHSSEQRGLDLTLPYYWNIAPNQDATFSLRPMSKRGIMLEGEYRYLGAKQSARLNGMWIDRDNKSLQSPRWSFKFDHRAQFNEHWQSELLLQDVSDVHFIEDYDYRPNVYNQWYLERYARLIGEGRYGTLII